MENKRQHFGDVSLVELLQFENNSFSQDFQHFCSYWDLILLRINMFCIHNYEKKHCFCNPVNFDLGYT